MNELSALPEHRLLESEVWITASVSTPSSPAQLLCPPLKICLGIKTGGVCFNFLQTDSWCAEEVLSPMHSFFHNGYGKPRQRLYCRSGAAPSSYFHAQEWNPANEWRAAIFSTISLKLITTHLVYILFTAHIVFKETQVLHSEWNELKAIVCVSYWI